MPAAISISRNPYTLAFIREHTTGNVSDTELVAAFKKKGDLQYLSTLYQRYMELVYGVCLKYFKEPERSRDAVMDIFEELNQKLRRYEVENFRSWLHVLARNHCLMQLRSPRHIKSAELNPAHLQQEQQPEMEEYLQREENFERMGKCMEQLPQAQRTSIELFYLQNKCYKEIAELTGYEWSKIRSFIQNGRRNLKICMEERIREIKANRP